MDIDCICADAVLDLKGFSCPMPLLKAKTSLEKLGPGQILEILGTDPDSKIDLPNWCRYTGHTFLGVKDEIGFFRFFIQKGGTPAPSAEHM